MASILDDGLPFDIHSRLIYIQRQEKRRHSLLVDRPVVNMATFP